jgi:glutaconate CoA-transferase subunit B
VLSFDDLTKRMLLENNYESTTASTVVENTGFELNTDNAEIEPPPSSEELRILREEVDPLRLILS